MAAPYLTRRKDRTRAFENLDSKLYISRLFGGSQATPSPHLTDGLYRLREFLYKIDKRAASIRGLLGAFLSSRASSSIASRQTYHRRP
jgi:hypothetical protein